MNIPPPPENVLVLRSVDLEAWVLLFGARLMQLWWMKAPEGPRPLTLGFAQPEDYLQDQAAMGAICGRYANRIADARLERDGEVWPLDANHPLGHCIHGGREGSGVQYWTIRHHDVQGVTLQLDMPDRHMGFPGHCVLTAQYQVRGPELTWQVHARLNKACPINLVQHSYWNLDQQPNLALHRLTVPRGHHHWPTDARELPTQCTPVEGTCFDFRAGAGFAAGDIDALDASIALTPSEGLCHAATLAVADMAMDLYTDRPNLHVYASRYLQATARPLGAAHAKGAGLCLETEDLPNGPALGEPVWYGPDRDYTHTMLFRFRNPSAPDPMD